VIKPPSFADVLSIRAAALLVAVALHASLFLLVDSRKRRPTIETLPTLRFYEALLPDQTILIAPKVETNSNAIEEALEIPTLEPQHAPVERASAPAPVDWAEEGELAAGSAISSIIREEGYRVIGPRKPSAPGANESPPSIFTEPKHKFGDIERDPFGYDRVWHNERCFTDIGQPVSARPDARIGNVNSRKCLRPLGKKKPRGDLFEHLKGD
jgi:hypothetical protein